jgi:hypothetical protein
LTRVRFTGVVRPVVPFPAAGTVFLCEVRLGKGSRITGKESAIGTFMSGSEIVVRTLGTTASEAAARATSRLLEVHIASKPQGVKP